MEYVAAGSEEIPFDDATFDVVTSLNSLDHVDDLELTIAEIKRVTAPGGHFVLAVEVGHRATLTEPQALSWDVCALFEPGVRGGGEGRVQTRRRARCSIPPSGASGSTTPTPRRAPAS